MPVTLAENTLIAGRYRLVRMIGRGGMGSVWLAINLRLDIPCALKFIEQELADNPEALQRFEREAKAAAQIRNPNVVHIADYGHHEGMPYIAMELLEGEDLGRRLNRELKLSPRETATIVMQVCRALQKAHSLEIVHRDLKPENIFLVREDDREVAKVLDFGIAKRFSFDDGAPSETRSGTMLGTPVYMSPEQAQGIKAVDYRTDLWALAVIAFRCLTGVLPFRSEALGDLLLKIIVNPLPVPSQWMPDVPAGFDAWWERAASRDPNRRFQTAKDFTQELDRALGLAPTIDGVDRLSDLPPVARTSSPLALSLPHVTTPHFASPSPRLQDVPFAGASLSPSTAPSLMGEPTPPAPAPKRSAGGALVWVALLAILGAATFVVLQPRSPGTAAARTNAPVVPEVVEEEEATPVEPIAAPTPAPSVSAVPSALAQARRPAPPPSSAKPAPPKAEALEIRLSR